MIFLTYNSTGKGRIFYDHLSYEDAIYVLNFYGFKKEALSICDLACLRMNDWPDHAFSVIGSIDQWKASILSKISSTDFALIMNAEISKFKLEKFLDHKIHEEPNFIIP